MFGYLSVFWMIFGSFFDFLGLDDFLMLSWSSHDAFYCSEWSWLLFLIFLVRVWFCLILSWASHGSNVAQEWYIHLRGVSWQTQQLADADINKFDKKASEYSHCLVLFSRLCQVEEIHRGPLGVSVFPPLHVVQHEGSIIAIRGNRPSLVDNLKRHVVLITTACICSRFSSNCRYLGDMLWPLTWTLNAESRVQQIRDACTQLARPAPFLEPLNMYRHSN